MLPLVEQLAATWTSIDELCRDLSETEWKTATGCPGWTVQDNISHLIDFETFALGWPRPDHEAAPQPHVKNEMGALNEIGVDARRGRTGSEVLAELREVTAARLASLAELTEDDLDREVQTPVGPGTMRDLLTMRVMDTWSHEQDIRRALGRPGHDDGPVVETVVGYLLQFVPFAVAKLAGAPDGSTVVVQVGERPPVGIEVVDRRGRASDALPTEPTVSLRMAVATFQALAGGRNDADPAAVELTGDRELGERIVANLGFLP